MKLSLQASLSLCFASSFLDSAFSFMIINAARPVNNIHVPSSWSSLLMSSEIPQASSGGPVYMIIEAQISDLETFSDYAAIVPSVVKQYGGEYIVLTGKCSLLEGEWGHCKDLTNLVCGDEKRVEEIPDEDITTQIFIQKWPNEEMAKRFWNSPEYAQLKKLREDTGLYRVMLVESQSN